MTGNDQSRTIVSPSDPVSRRVSHLRFFFRFIDFSFVLWMTTMAATAWNDPLLQIKRFQRSESPMILIPWLYS